MISDLGTYDIKIGTYLVNSIRRRRNVYSAVKSTWMSINFDKMIGTAIKSTWRSNDLDKNIGTYLVSSIRRRSV